MRFEANSQALETIHLLYATSRWMSLDTIDVCGKIISFSRSLSDNALRELNLTISTVVLCEDVS